MTKQEALDMGIGDTKMFGSSTILLRVPNGWVLTCHTLHGITSVFIPEVLTVQVVPTPFPDTVGGANG